MKRFLLLTAAAAVLFLIVIMPVIGQDVPAVKYEGEGFETPEKAVEAFVDALSRNDAGAALSTFAVESMVDHRDAAAVIERMMMLNPYNNLFMVPNDNEWIRELKIVKRYAEAAGYLYNQYVTFTIGDGIDLGSGKMIYVRTQKELDEVKALLGRPERQEFLENIRLAEVLDPVEAGVFNGRGMWRTYTRQAEYYAAEDFAPLAAHILAGDRHGLIFLECGRYDGRWYNLTVGGILSNTLGLDNYQGGMLLMSTADYAAAIAGYMLNADPDVKANYREHLKSELTGTVWKLTEYVGMPEDYVIAESFADLERYGEEKAVFAQIHFTRWGYSMIAKELPADPDTKLSNWENAGNWREENGVLEMEGLGSEKVLHVGSRLMLVMGDGTVAAFEQIR